MLASVESLREHALTLVVDLVKLRRDCSEQSLRFSSC